MTTTTMQSIDDLKQQLKTMWSTGDYGLIALGMQESAEAFLAELGVAPDERFLDVACGSGQMAVPAARAGAQVTGIDIAPEWLAQARHRAETEGVAVTLDVGDVENMPYADESFDTVMSLIGAMFAPRPDRTLSEMLRVCRPGGRIIMGNWTAQGLVGKFFATIGKYAPPPDMPSPLLWGDEETVKARFGDSVSDLRLARRMMHFRYPMPPAEVAEHYVNHFGPVMRARATLDPAGQKALGDDIEALWAGANTATDGMTEVDGEFLEVVAVKA
ncbi:MAG: SAM-dependent methyltransferase [Rhodospirillaceae bacterium]|nr:SAM-dependent methyltransferase [Rhodospirillaceae bacterium]|tara:strand:- start:1029 stop:1847 length:819 start_codon:yes stop_codon:yes gene_type:complete